MLSYQVAKDQTLAQGPGFSPCSPTTLPTQLQQPLLFPNSQHILRSPLLLLSPPLPSHTSL